MAGNVTKLSDGVIIEHGVIIPCPMVGFSNRRATKCAECDLFQGLREINPDEKVPWHLRYMIICGHPIDRRCDMVSEE